MGAERTAYREVMSRFPTGVTVISMRAGDVVHGMTANAVASLSLDPLLFLVCVDHTARAYPILEQAGHFVVNFLASGQADVSRTFALKDLTDDERWSTVSTHPSSVGAPRIDGCVGYLDCVVAGRFPGGDHTIYVGEVVHVEPGASGEPLVFHRGRYRTLA